MSREHIEGKGLKSEGLSVQGVYRGERVKE